jgi:pyridoxamine 5'-phosphate oxidase
MNQRELMAEVETILEDAKTAILSTVDGNDRPHVRWMTPVVLRERFGALFAVTSPSFEKVRQLKAHAEVEWMLQTRSLNKIVTLKGVVNLLDNVSIRSEVLEAVGPRLNVFWRVNTDERDLLVLETVIREAIFWAPMKGVREVISFSGGGRADGSKNNR